MLTTTNNDDDDTATSAVHWPSSPAERALLLGNHYLMHNLEHEASRLGWCHRGFPKPQGSPPSSREATSALYPITWRSCYKYVEIYRGLGAETLNYLKGTTIDQAVHLKRLAAMAGTVERDIYIRNVASSAFKKPKRNTK